MIQRVGPHVSIDHGPQRPYIGSRAMIGGNILPYAIGNFPGGLAGIGSHGSVAAKNARNQRKREERLK